MYFNIEFLEIKSPTMAYLNITLRVENTEMSAPKISFSPTPYGVLVKISPSSVTDGKIVPFPKGIAN
jgi:hypothetical protein